MEVEKMGVFRDYSARELLFLQGKRLSHYYFVLDGLVSTYHQNEQGKKWVASFFSNGDFFPHVGLASEGGIYPASAEIVTDTTLFLLPASQAQKLFSAIPQLQVQLTQFLFNKSQELMTRFSASLFDGSSEQLLAFLQNIAMKIGQQQTDGRFLVRLPMKERDLADYIGLAPETISRAFRQLCEAGLVEKLPEKNLLIK